MARRKSINKRLSRYSRQSAGSAILDPDTNILTEEDPYWWRNLDNNTLARLSVDSNAFNQTSRHLDPNSQVEGSQAADGWWKVLDASSASSKSKTNADNAKKDAIGSASESESEGEPRIAKRKFPFRSEVRRPEGNAFLNALNDTTHTTATERAQKSRRKDSMSNAPSHSKTITNIAEVQKNSSNESHSSNDILKLRPDVFKRNYKTRNTNAFVDILKEDKLQSSSREKSLKLAANNESHIVTEHRVPATAETSTFNQTEPNQFALSFENEHDLSRFPVPKAQSTIIEGGNWPVPDKVEDNSNIENEIVKPRSKLMTRHRTKKNLFDNVFEELETTNEIVKGNLINQNATVGSNISEQTLKQANNSAAEARNPVVDDKYNRKKIRTSSMSKRNEHMAESAQNVKESTERKLQEELSSISSHRSNVNRGSSVVRKANSALLTRSGENAEKNRFLDILEEWNDVDTSGSRNTEISLIREEEENAAVKNVVPVENKSKRSKIDEGSNRHLSDLHTELLDNSNEGNIPTSTVEHDKNYNRKTRQSIRSSSESELYDLQDVGNKPSKSSSALEMQSSLHDTEAIKSTSKRMTSNTNSRHALLDSHAIEKAVDVESPKIEDASKRLRSRSSRLQNSSLLRSMNESESEEAESRPQKGKMNTRRTKVRSDSHAIEKAADFESPKTEDASKRLRSRSSRLPNGSLLRSMNESESEETESTPQKDKINTRRTKVRSDSHATEKAAEFESPKTQDASKRQRIRSSKLQNYSLMRSMNVSESEEAESTPQKDKINTRRAKVRSDSHAAEKAAEFESPKTKDASKRQRTRTSKLQNNSLLRSMNESESEEAESTPQKDEMNTRRAKGRSDSHAIGRAAEFESSKTQDASKRQRTRSSKLQNYSLMRSMNVSESEEAESSPQKDKVNTRRTKVRSDSGATEKAAEFESPKTQNASKRQRTGSSKLQNYSLMRSMNESESEEAESTPQKDKISTRRTKVRSDSHATEKVAEFESPKTQDASKRQRTGLSKLQNYSLMRSVNEFESEEAEITPQKDEMNTRRTKVRSDSHAIERAAEFESPKTQDASKRHRTRSSKLQNYSMMRSTNESELEKGEDTPRRNKRSTSRIKGQSSSHAIEKAAEVQSPKTQDVSKRKRTRSSKLQNYSTMRSTNESELEKTEDTPRRNKRSMSRIKERSNSPIMRPVELPKPENVPSKRQSDRQGTSRKHSHLSMIQKQSDPLVSEEDEPAEALDVSRRHSERLSNERTYLSPESTTRRSTRSLSRAEKRSTLPAPEEAESTQTQYTPTKQTDLRSKSLKYSRSPITNDSESSKTQSPSRRSNRNLSRGRVDQSVSPAARKTKRSGAQTVSQKRSEAFTNTQSYLTLPDQTGLESERVGNATQNVLPSARILNANVQKGQQSIKSFFSIDTMLPASQAFSDEEKLANIKRELDRVKECEMARMKQDQQNRETKPLSLRERLMNKRGMNMKVTLQKQRSNKPVHKAFLVNGQVYKAPRLPRPQRWITDRLYKYLWKRMEPKCKLETRVASEKFVQQLSNVTTLIIKRKSYIHYKTELHALMKEMARLDIIKSRNDFYNFCQDFFPYELRIKTVPMLLPGNKRNIPYDADKLHEPLLTP